MTEIKKNPELINKVISTDGAHLTVEGYDLTAKHTAPNILKLLTMWRAFTVSSLIGCGIGGFSNNIYPSRKYASFYRNWPVCRGKIHERRTLSSRNIAGNQACTAGSA